MNQQAQYMAGATCNPRNSLWEHKLKQALCLALACPAATSHQQSAPTLWPPSRGTGTSALVTARWNVLDKEFKQYWYKPFLKQGRNAAKKFSKNYFKLDWRWFHLTCTASGTWILQTAIRCIIGSGSATDRALAMFYALLLVYTSLHMNVLSLKKMPVSWLQCYLENFHFSCNNRQGEDSK